MNRRMFLGQAAMAYGAFLLHARAQGTSHSPALTIREIRAVRLRDGFNSRFIRVYTDQGLTGKGEMLDTVGAEYIVNHNIGPSLAGSRPAGYRRDFVRPVGLEAPFRRRFALATVYAGHGRTLPDRHQRSGNGAVGPGG
jgi:hypothetical protein